MAVSVMGIPVADEPKDSVMWKEADAFMAQMRQRQSSRQKELFMFTVGCKIGVKKFRYT